MLLSFRFANHRSFRDEQQLNLMPAYASGEGRGDLEPVRTVGIFGANASGKSNCLDALSFMAHMATTSDREVEPGSGIVRQPFRLDRQSMTDPSRYVVDLVLHGIRHTYGFTISDDCVLEEWFYHYPLGRKRRLFEREVQAFAWGEESGKRSELERIAAITAPTALFLSTAARFVTGSSSANDAFEPLHDVYRWFYGSEMRTEPGLTSFYPRQNWPQSYQDQHVVIELLKAADIGIVDVSLRADPPAEENLGDLLLFGPRSSFEQSMMQRLPTGRRRALHRLQFLHRGAEEDAVLTLAQESTGTRQLLGLAIDAAHILRVGGVMTVDEIDASLHPMLSARLAGLFQSSETNPHGSQLIFTSHDATLLGAIDGEEVLRRDEIWFTEKHDDGSSVLYPLSDFKPRKEGENRLRRYMNGNYGAMPHLSAYLFERAVAAREGSDGSASAP